jgi:hypothetical protein
MRFVLMLLLSITLQAVEVPEYVLVGILKVETRSYYRENGTIRYVDQRRGAAGEIGPFQMTRRAFNQIRKRGELFWDIETDRAFAEECAKRYLVWLYNNSAKQDWSLAIQYYNAGPGNRSAKYLDKVLLASNN